jgi:hypothetical protein
VPSAGTGIVVWLLVALVAGGGACSSEHQPPTELVDGSRTTPPPFSLDAPTPQIQTKVAVVQPLRRRAGTATGPCLAAARDHAPSGPLVARIGVSGLSVTFPTASGRALVACDSGRAEWCGRAYGRLEHGRLHDPRLDLACTTAEGAPLAFGWFEPGRGTVYVAVRQPGYVEAYRVAGRAPVRISTTSGISATNSSATFDVSEHDRRGALLRRSTFVARVAG